MVIGVLRMQRNDGERKAAFEVVREAAIPLLRATDRARNFAVFLSAGAGIAVFGGRSLTTGNWRLRLAARPTPEVGRSAQVGHRRRAR